MGQTPFLWHVLSQQGLLDPLSNCKIALIHHVQRVCPRGPIRCGCAASRGPQTQTNLPCASGETPPAWHAQRRLPNQGAAQSEPELCPICLRHAVDCTPRTTQAAECATCGWLWGWHSATGLAKHTAIRDVRDCLPQPSFIIDPRLQLFGNERRAPNWSPQHHDTPGLPSFFTKLSTSSGGSPPLFQTFILSW